MYGYNISASELDIPMRKKGSIIIPEGISVWPHELTTATALASAGHRVEFLPIHGHGTQGKSPDILMDNKKWEIKSPKASSPSSIERNIKRAYQQSTNIVFDSQRMKHLPDKNIQRELCRLCRLNKQVSNLIFVNRKREVIDISDLLT
jgi:hypothetical protein